ncbi:hypothetical protein [Undibacter mobilis]|uniref:hypothetical protein n=1 Tax=Undibacter mobilis TaxID=2292256 RepID=UPI0011C04B11|nr:hypothetical protein [Undibacter mobilis]
MPKGIHYGFNLLSQRKSRNSPGFLPCEWNMVNGGGIPTGHCGARRSALCESSIANGSFQCRSAFGSGGVSIGDDMQGTDVPVSTQTSSMPWPAMLLSLLVGGIFALTIGLWAYFGSAVFFEMVRSGLAACF